VGKTVTIKDKFNESKKIVIKNRPKQCALCSIGSEIHAMHPLYNKHGIDGQPVVKDGTIVWVHTLCALFIAGYELTRGIVYGCTINGEYQSDSDLEADENDESDNSNKNNGQVTNVDHRNNFSFFQTYHNDKEALVGAPHHFVITYRGDGAENNAISMLKDIRENLRCSICNNPDQRSKRISVQVGISFSVAKE
jgi:hypothetical protein